MRVRTDHHRCHAVNLFLYMPHAACNGIDHWKHGARSWSVRKAVFVLCASKDRAIQHHGQCLLQWTPRRHQCQRWVSCDELLGVDISAIPLTIHSCSVCSCSFGGGDEISHNLVFSTCRESGDHGPFNSWDRQPFLTTVRDGTPSMTPAVREIHHNFFIDNYSPQENVDNDDGSSYYSTHDNFMVRSVIASCFVCTFTEVPFYLPRFRPLV